MVFLLLEYRKQSGLGKIYGLLLMVTLCWILGGLSQGIQIYVVDRQECVGIILDKRASAAW